jgi:hypothetical protein
MSLHDIAKHVQSQGRGQDTVLVHMTPNEVGGLQALAKSQGGSLTRNPETGLYEAGFLSSVLPMVAGVAASAFLGPEMLPLVAGGIGLADYAMTGSLQQGLMAGLGAWSGYSLGAGIGAAGAADLAEQGANMSEETFKASQAKALEGQAMDASRGMVEPNLQDIAKNQLANSGLTAEQQTIFQNAVANNPDQAANIMRGAGAAAVNPTAQQGFAQGITSLGDIGKGIAANPLAAAGAALPLVSGALFKQPTVNAPASSVTNVNQPLQRLSPDYKGTITTTPATHYQATYPNYVATPYNPYTGTPAVTSPRSIIYGADGGLMQGGPVNVDFMGGDMYPQSQIQRSYYATPTQMPTSAQQTAASYEPKTNPLTGEPTAHMAEGGIAGLADGGKTADYIYHPSYTNYAQTPYNPTNAQPYNGIPIPTRAPMGNMQTPGIAGYAIDPKGMIGSPAYKQLQDELAAAQAAAAAAQAPQTNYDYGGGGKAGGVMPDDLIYAGGGLTAFADGGISNLGSYSDGGRLLKGPGDGVSDGIPAQIGARQPARLADGEFVVPARIVSELGNGSTDAGAKRLYAMMERVQAKRKKSMGKGKFAVNSKAEKDLPA